jgi:hypothetical protein
MRRSIATVGALVLGLVALTPGAAPAAPDGGAGVRVDPGPSAADRAALSAGLSLGDKAAPNAKPAGPNPFLALLPDPVTADYTGWTKTLEKQAGEKAAARLRKQAAAGALKAAPVSPLLVDEDEPVGTRDANDEPSAAQLVAGFGTAAGQNAKARVLGRLDPEVATTRVLPAHPEDDGSIPLAGETGIGEVRRGIVTSAVIGDGPHGKAGTSTGDFDFYRLDAGPGEIITVRTDTQTGVPVPDTVAGLYAADGTLLAYNDDGDDGFDSLLTYTTTRPGPYFVMVTGYNTRVNDPMDPASGTGAATEGPYSVTITAAEVDVDYYAVKLRKGDVLGASVKGAAAYLTIYDTEPREVHGSDQDASALYPMASPLPGGGNAVTEHVATKAGWHYVGVADGTGGYDITVEAYRPPLQGAKPTQTLFLDFDGARVNTAVFGGDGVEQLSPLAAFLANWGIPRVQEDALIDAIVARVTENVKQDLVASGLNTRFKIKILNSRDHADPFGAANVSRIIIGGTVAESGVDTIGISQSIDPGNFETEETSLVLLDYLSEPAGDDLSLNTYLTAASDRIGFVGSAVGNVVAHEAGHFFGNWHVDQFNDRANLMDQGGNFALLYGVGPDEIGGTADDTDVDFGDDTFNPSEGFLGTEETLGRVVFGVTS